MLHIRMYVWRLDIDIVLNTFAFDELPDHSVGLPLWRDKHSIMCNNRASFDPNEQPATESIDEQNRTEQIRMNEWNKKRTLYVPVYIYEIWHSFSLLSWQYLQRCTGRPNFLHIVSHAPTHNTFHVQVNSNTKYFGFEIICKENVTSYHCGL